MVKRRRHSTLHLLHDRGRLIGMTFLLFLALIRLAQSVKRHMPDTAGTEFWFTTPLCDNQNSVHLLIVPQTTETVNVTIETLDSSVTIDNGAYTITKDGVLHIPLECSVIQWNQVDSSGYTILTTSEVNVYVEYSDDSHIVLPNDVLANSYIAVAPSFTNYQLAFIVIYGNTSTVNISLPDTSTSSVIVDGNTYLAGSEINVTLPINGVLAISCMCNLTGVAITSDLPVAILSGGKESNSAQGYIEAVPPLGSWGRKFLLPAHPWISETVTLVIAAKWSQTEVKMEGDYSDTIIIGDSKTSRLQLQLSDVLSISSNSSIACAVLYSIIDKSSNQHASFRLLSPLELYHIKHRFFIDQVQDDTTSANFILKQASFGNVNFNATQINPFTQIMTFYDPYFISKHINLLSPGSVQISDSNSVPLHGTIFHRSDLSAYEYNLGMRITNIYDACVNNSKAYGGNGDGVDNDCDNSIDEETLNKIDDDKDGLVDEDVKYAGNVGQRHKETVWEYHIRNAEKEETGLSISLISIVISVGVALASVVLFIGGMLLFEKIRRSTNSTRVTPIF